MNSEAVGAGAFSGAAPTGPFPVLIPPNCCPSAHPDAHRRSERHSVNTKSGYALETANYRDLLILTGGLRFDQYDITAAKAGYPTIAANDGMWNYNVGAVVKPVPITSIYWAYGTSSEPIGAELDGTSANYGGLNPTSPINQIFGPIESTAQEVGNQVGAVRPSICSRPPLCSAPTSAMPASWFRPAIPMPAPSRPAPPITSRASISAPKARSPTSGASIPAWC